MMGGSLRELIDPCRFSLGLKVASPVVAVVIKQQDSPTKPFYISTPYVPSFSPIPRTQAQAALAPQKEPPGFIPGSDERPAEICSLDNMYK